MPSPVSINEYRDLRGLGGGYPSGGEGVKNPGSDFVSLHPIPVEREGAVLEVIEGTADPQDLTCGDRVAHGGAALLADFLEAAAQETPCDRVITVDLDRAAKVPQRLCGVAAPEGLPSELSAFDRIDHGVNRIVVSPGDPAASRVSICHCASSVLFRVRKRKPPRAFVARGGFT